MNKKLTIVIPAYNEEEALVLYLPKVIKHCEINNYLLIVVNDGSKDKTKMILDDFCKQTQILQVIHHKVNRGYGGAIKSGIKSAVTEFVITIDADGQHNLEDVDVILQEMIQSDADLIVGSRVGQKSATYLRGLGKFLIRKIAGLLLPVNVSDLNSGMKMYNTHLAKEYIGLCPDSMAYSDIIVLVFTHHRCLIKEVPISINKRVGGESTIGINTAFETVREIINIVLLFNPLKIFLPASLVILLVTLIWGVPIVIGGKGVSTGTLLGLMLSVFLFFLGVIAEQVSILQKKKL